MSEFREETFAMLNPEGPQTDAVLHEAEGGILRITLSAPSKRNPLSSVTLAHLTDLIQRADTDDAVRVVIIGHEGPAFSAGHDLKEVMEARKNADGGKSFFTTLMTQCSLLMQSIVTCGKPVIAMVDGIATAAGCQLVASCDLAYASANSRFSTPGVHIGLFCSTPMVALSRNISRKHAMEMLLTGTPVSAEKAVETGLINAVFEAEEFEEHVLSIARGIASKSSATVKIGKQAFYHQAELPLAEAYAYASQVMVENLEFADAKEGIAAFMEKRDPRWRDE